jgi:nicotinate-nucleotide pyrophosphorylase (carboxylating)
MKVGPGQPEWQSLRRLLELGRGEDFGAGDVTCEMLPGAAKVRGRFVARQELILCGGVFLAEIAAAYDRTIQTALKAEEGRLVPGETVLAEWAGKARPILAAERVALNFLQHLSGIATLTRKYVDAVAGTGAAIYDTRKTAPGWRALEKYAVRAGGGRNHRMGLYDAVLVKDNHLAVLSRSGRKEAIAALKDKLPAVRKKLPAGGFIELEVNTLGELAEALKLPVDVVMLDNMSVADLRRALEMRDKAKLRGKVALEASGGITLANVRAVAETGVERIAVGALTHSAAAVDIALDVEAT